MNGKYWFLNRWVNNCHKIIKNFYKNVNWSLEMHNLINIFLTACFPFWMLSQKENERSFSVRSTGWNVQWFLAVELFRFIEAELWEISLILHSINVCREKEMDFYFVLVPFIVVHKEEKNCRDCLVWFFVVIYAQFMNFRFLKVNFKSKFFLKKL